MTSSMSVPGKGGQGGDKERGTGQGREWGGGWRENGGGEDREQVEKRRISKDQGENPKDMKPRKGTHLRS